MLILFGGLDQVDDFRGFVRPQLRHTHDPRGRRDEGRGLSAFEPGESTICWRGTSPTGLRKAAHVLRVNKQVNQRARKG